MTDEKQYSGGSVHIADALLHGGNAVKASPTTDPNLDPNADLYLFSLDFEADKVVRGVTGQFMSDLVKEYEPDGIHITVYGDLEYGADVAANTQTLNRTAEYLKGEGYEISSQEIVDHLVDNYTDKYWWQSERVPENIENTPRHDLISPLQEAVGESIQELIPRDEEIASWWAGEADDLIDSVLTETGRQRQEREVVVWNCNSSPARLSALTDTTMAFVPETSYDILRDLFARQGINLDGGQIKFREIGGFIGSTEGGLFPPDVDISSYTHIQGI